MADEAGDVSSSVTGPPRENEATVTSTNRGCRGCLYYSSIMREHGRDPICLGLSRNSDSHSQVYTVQSELEKEVTKNLRKFSDFKYACIGYSTHKELSSNPSSPSIEGPSELPNCVGLEFLADRKPTRHGVPAHPPPLSTSTPTTTDQSHKGEDGPTVMPRPPSSIGGLGGGGLSGDEFATRFYRTAGLVATAVVNNVSKVANSVRTTIDDIFTSDQGRPKS